jgi:hypothetical protein
MRRGGEAGGRGGLGKKRAAMKLSDLTCDFVQQALTESKVWDLGDSVLYELCRCHTGHADADAIVAKFWLIRRAYSAAAERRPTKDNLGGAGAQFYEKHLVPEIRKSPIDKWFDELRLNVQTPLQVHKLLTQLLSENYGVKQAISRIEISPFPFSG